MKDSRLRRAGTFVLCLLIIVTDVAAEPLYTVKEGDTLWSIARAHGMDYAQLCKSNAKPQGWSLIFPGQKIIVGKPLDDAGDVSLFAWETASDVAFNKSSDWLSRNSLFMRRRTAAGTNEWRLIMTAEGDWKLADGMSEWCKDRACDARRDFHVMKARLSKDGKSIWMVCNPHIGTYSIVCSFNLAKNTFRVLIDGDTADEQPDGTILVKNKKFYPNDDLGAAWHDVWITPDGTIVRKGPITLRGADL